MVAHLIQRRLLSGVALLAREAALSQLHTGAEVLQTCEVPLDGPVRFMLGGAEGQVNKRTEPLHGEVAGKENR